MGFAVTCNSCQARFLLNDDLLKRRVAGRVVTVRCRQCQATIEVDASNVDPVTLTESMRPDALEEVVAPLKPAMPKPAPPPRPPAKSTLMGIGAPRPAGAKELVALSPGLLGVETKPKPPQPMSAHGFPEPPPPPSGGPVEELNSSDWKISEPPPALRPAVANETTILDSDPPSSGDSIDEFVESLPSSVPPAEVEPTPSSSGTPSLQALAHHDQKVAAARKQDDFFLNMTAALNGGVASEMSAPTIDVSNLGAPQSSPPSGIDAPLKGGQTLPLFAMGDPAAALLNTPAPKSVPPQLPASASKSAAASSAPPSRGPDSPRERKNVVAPVEKKTKAEAPSPSRLAGPLLLALAAAAGFLIWKSGAGSRAAPEPTPEVASTPEAVAQPEPAKVAEPSTPAIAVPPSSASAATAATTAPAEAATKTQPPGSAAAHATSDKATSSTTSGATPAATPSASPEKPAATPAEAKPDAAAAAATPATPKEEPAAAPAEAAPPAEPAGPFDRAAAAAALNAAAAQASACRKEGDPSGIAAVTITFAPSGRVTSANISGPPFAGTPTGGCIASTLRKAKIPAFDGDRVTVSKTITIQ